MFSTNRQRWLLSLIALMALGLAGNTTRTGAAQADCRTFKETKQEVCYDFLSYWRANGGLAQQGYPITARIQEVNPTDGKPYIVQYFERAVFELHTEKDPPNRVLLSLLGTFRYNAKYPDGAPNQQPNNSEGSQLFTETGFRVGGKFLDYWRANGGLAQQGLPISDEFTEVSALDGKEYRVQYFERAVFEYHPENEAPNDVLLSQLGTFRMKERTGEVVEFQTDDGVKLVGSLYGEGTTAVVLSAMCSDTGKEDWTDFALLLKEKGYMALTYYYRGIEPSGGRRAVSELDIAAAVDYVRSKGAEQIVLAGASCGGMLSALEATQTEAAGLIVMASPGRNGGVGAEDEMLATIGAPKLFISAEGDSWTDEMMALYNVVPEPKEVHLYKGNVHGTSLFYTEYGADLTQRLLTFIQQVSAP